METAKVRHNIQQSKNIRFCLLKASGILLCLCWNDERFALVNAFLPYNSPTLPIENKVDVKFYGAKRRSRSVFNNGMLINYSNGPLHNRQVQHALCMTDDDELSKSSETILNDSSFEKAQGREITIDSSKPGEMVATDKGVRQRKRDSAKNLLKRLANLSLMDYDWRSNALREKEADRQYEESIARLTGSEAPYIRPMDAHEDKRGPLGMIEKFTLEWFTEVIEEEAERARRISESDGELVRPMDVTQDEDGTGEMRIGPLGELERAANNFIESIINSEIVRTTQKVLRPKDLDPSERGPLGDAEAQAMSLLTEIAESERIRGDMGRRRKSLVRPIDVVGPLGEVELAVSRLVQSEQKRFAQAEKAMEESGKYTIVRPMDAIMPGPLGTVEKDVSEACEKIRNEEIRRLENMKRALEDNRPMENDKNSFLGLAETIVVGIVRAPIMLASVISRVRELMKSETLDEKDRELLERTEKAIETFIMEDADDINSSDEI